MPKVSEQYQVATELARGVLGPVSVGQSPTRVVLLRTLVAGDPWTAALLDRLAASAESAATIHHPAVLAVISVARSDKDLVIASEYVQGVPLRTLMERARERKRLVPPHVAKRIVLDLARAIAAVDELMAGQSPRRAVSWIHPECILISSGDDALMADVGISTLDQVPEHAEIAAYRAPELVPGAAAGPAAAVYSLGILLWELLAGRDALGQTAPGARAMSVRQRALAGAVPRLDLVARDAPALLIETAMQAIHRDPAARFPDVRALAETLAAGEAARPGQLIRFMTELAGDLVERQRGQVVLPQSAATSWRPTVHPLDNVPVPKIPKAPRQIGLAAFRQSSTPPPPDAIGERPTLEVEVPATPLTKQKPAPDAAAPMQVEIAQTVTFGDTRGPQKTLPLLLVNKPVVPVISEDAPASARSEPEEPPPFRRRRVGPILFVLLIFGSAAAVGVLALRKQMEQPQPEPAATLALSATPPASAAGASSVQDPSPSAAPVPSASAPTRTSNGDRERPRERDRDRERAERPRSSSEPGVKHAPSAEPPVTEEPNPNSDNPYVAPKPAPTADPGF